MNRTPSSVRRLPLGMLLGLALFAGAARPAHATLYASYATALSVSGSDYYQTTSSPFNPNQFAFTAELWFKATSTSGTQVLVSQLNGTGTGRSWLYVKSGVLATGLGGTELLGKTTITPATWHTPPSFTTARGTVNRSISTAPSILWAPRGPRAPQGTSCSAQATATH